MMPVHPDWAGPGRGWPRRCGQDDGDADRHPAGSARASSSPTGPPKPPAASG